MSLRCFHCGEEFNKTALTPLKTFCSKRCAERARRRRAAAPSDPLPATSCNCDGGPSWITDPDDTAIERCWKCGHDRYLEAAA